MLGTLSLFLAVGPFAAENENPAPGHLPPDFWTWKVPTLNGDTVTLAQYRGHYLLLQFWGEWCPTCIQEMPFLRGIKRRYVPGRLQMVGFVRAYDLEKAKRRIVEDTLNWPQIELNESMKSAFAIEKYPTNWLIDPKGRIVMRGFANHYRDFKHRLELGEEIPRPSPSSAGP